MPRYRPVDARVDLPAMERAVLEFWRDARIFDKSVRLREGAPEWIFYEGPPTANGRPGIHHVEARTFKDLYPRFKTMTGHHVERKAGWDCHGIPVELQIEREIGTKTKRDIEAFGVAEFNRLCRESVKRYVDDWAALTERIGFWIDLDQAYWTMDPGYIESVWWALKRLHGEGLLYRDDKVTAYCPRCGTPLSDHEVAQGYTTVEDPSVFVRFPVEEGGPEAAGAALVAWTTTPWTLISNQGLVVAIGEPYVRVRLDGGDELIVAAARRETLPEGEVVATFDSSALVGARYRPPFDNPRTDATHRVVASAGVSTDEGTGVVHMASAFGAEDLEVGRREGWPVYKPVDDEVRFQAPAPEFVRGRFVKDADPLITDDLRRRGLLVDSGTIEHTYPLCWRCDTPLIYLARPAWYIRTTAFKQQLLDANETVNWYPDNIKHGRFGDWLANNVDWSLSRERYWGTPLPVWVCAGGHETAVGSLAELSELAGRDVTGMDPHKPFIDEVTLPCPACGEEARRVPYLIDVWFDAGAMPFAQWGYRDGDGEAEASFRRQFPADFIAEGLDQTRGWFYTLMAESVLLFGRSPYRNVVCLGLLVDRQGRKMSKRLGNVIDPWEVIDRFGADALRWFLVSTGSPWAARRVSLEAFEDVVRRFLLTLWNVYAFYVTYANIDEPALETAPPPGERPPLDRWALSRLHSLVMSVRDAMDAYDATGAARQIDAFVDDLSNWYVRRSRRRFWDPARAGARGGADDKVAAYATLEECLRTVATLLAPITPFVADELHRNLVANVPGAAESVHLSDFPVGDAALVDPALEAAMADARAVVSLGRTVRADAKVKVRQPLARAIVHVADPRRLADVVPVIADELNVKEVAFAASSDELSRWRARPNFRSLGPRLGPLARDVAAMLADDDGTLASALASAEPVHVEAGGTRVSLSPEDADLSREPLPGWGVAAGGGITVAIDLTPSDELRREGIARELIHAVQGVRRDADLGVSDRIVLAVETHGSGEVAEAVDRYRDHVAREVLATDLRDGRLEDAERTASVTIDSTRVELSLRRA